MKEMVGGCCVCSDERGWPDNPLVYCDGNGCTVAVHQACYGIVTVPTGPWFCRKCESSDRQTKVRCELCPSRSGALKRADTGGWAHVVCALYIPEIRFGNVTSMEPIILQLIPPERFNKVCCICHEMGKVNRASVGACMQCNKSGCKQQFHVTCAQSFGLLCEEAGNYLDNVKYCGYCKHHYSKLKKGGNVKTIPPYKPVSQDSQSSDSCPEKEAEEVTSGSPNLQSKGVTSKSGIGGGNTASTSGRKSGQQGASTSKAGNSTASKTASAAVGVYTAATPTEPLPSTSGMSSNSKQATQSKSSNPIPKVQGKNQHPEKSSASKKVPVVEVAKRSSSAVPPTENIEPSAITTSTIVAPLSSNQTEQTTADASSFYQEIPSAPPTPNKSAVQPEALIMVNQLPYTGPSVVTGPSPTSGDQQPGGQKFTNSNFTESVVTNSDSVFGIGAETKHTKKRKAANLVPVVSKQRSSEDLNVESNYKPNQEANCEEPPVVNPATTPVPKNQV